METDLRDLLLAWFRGEIETSRRDDLLGRLRRDEAFRMAFVAEIRMLGMLWVVHTGEPRWLRMEDGLGWTSLGSDADRAGTLADRVVSLLPGHPLRRNGKKRWWIAGIGAAVVCLLAVVLFTHQKPKQTPPEEAGLIRREVRPTSRIGPSSGLAVVVRLDGVRRGLAADQGLGVADRLDGPERPPVQRHPGSCRPGDLPPRPRPPARTRRRARRVGGGLWPGRRDGRGPLIFTSARDHLMLTYKAAYQFVAGSGRRRWLAPSP